MADEHNTPDRHHYRVKLIHAEGRIETTLEIAATTEADAVAQVQGLTMSYAIELWDEGRLVRTLPFAERDQLAVSLRAVVL